MISNSAFKVLGIEDLRCPRKFTLRSSIKANNTLFPPGVNTHINMHAHKPTHTHDHAILVFLSLIDTIV